MHIMQQRPPYEWGAWPGYPGQHPVNLQQIPHPRQPRQDPPEVPEPPHSPQVSDNEDQQHPVNNPQMPAGTAPFLTLAQHLPEGVVGQIVANRYVNLLKLAPNNPNEGERDMCMVPSPDRKPTFRPVKDNQKINNFFQYLCLILIYGVPYLTAHLEQGLEFLQYISTTLDSDLRYNWPAVLQYDMDFRRFRQNNPNHSWVESVLSLQNQRQNQGFGQDGRQPICDNFNKGTCFK